MDLGLKDRKVLITGGSKGIGLACARAFIAEGAKVALVSRSQANLDAAKKSVVGLLEQFGWESADMGKAEAARAIEPLCMLWCIPGFLRNDWVHAFKLLT